MKFINKKTKVLSYLPQILAMLFLAGLAVSVQAGSSDNVSGFAWSNMYRATGDPLGPHDPTIGWISFNSKNCDANGDGKSDGAPAGCPASGTAIPNYGITINSNGNFSGYAWSENIGWIQFNPSGPYPASPNYSACLDFPGNGQACDGIGNHNVGGWARALSYGGGWDGWIKLRGSNYGVSVDKKTGKLSGYAWSDMVIGWISFSGNNYGAVTTLAFNGPPNKPGTPLAYSPDGVSWNHCSFQGKSSPTFHWTYSDPDSDSQSAYEIEIYDNSEFTVPKFNHLVNLIVPSPSDVSYVLNLSQDDNADWIPTELSWNTNYFWRVMVKDSQGNSSSWSNLIKFKTSSHAYPYPNFTWLPAEPTQAETVVFNPDSSIVYGGAAISSYLWSIIQGTGSFVDGTSASSRYPHIQFSTSNNRVKLRITDSDGYSCGAGTGEGEKDIIAELPLPEYKEVSPSSWFRKVFAGIFARIF